MTLRSYPKSPSPNTVDAWVAQAFNSVTQTWTNYVKGGGIPAVFGEWTLAGAWLVPVARAEPDPNLRVI